MSEMHRRQFLGGGLAAAAGLIVGGSATGARASEASDSSAVDAAKTQAMPTAIIDEVTGPNADGEIRLPELGFEADSGPYAPQLDWKLFDAHYSRHHKGHVKRLNSALKEYDGLRKKGVEYLVRNVKTIPSAIRRQVRNHGGAHLNHTLYWRNLQPAGVSKPSTEFVRALGKSRMSFEMMCDQFFAPNLFGSGWSFIVVDVGGKLATTTTKNEDSPLMDGLIPIAALDLWEHAYTAQYHDRRREYLDAMRRLIDWKKVSERHSAAVALQAASAKDDAAK